MTFIVVKSNKLLSALEMPFSLGSFIIVIILFENTIMNNYVEFLISMFSHSSCCDEGAVQCRQSSGPVY